MLVSFEEYIEKSNRAKTDQELMAVFLETIASHGYDRMTLCLFSDHRKIGLKAGAHYLRNYPADWMKYYVEKDFWNSDPVLRFLPQSGGTFAWKDIDERMPITAHQQSILDMGAEAGLNNGICVPMWGDGQMAGVGLASTEKIDSCDNNLDLLTAYCNHFYLAFQRLHRAGTTRPCCNIVLTPKEREVLLWASQGKTDPEIGDIMGISDHGVGFHLRNVYKKLEANNRILAVTKAISLGLITA